MKVAAARLVLINMLIDPLVADWILALQTACARNLVRAPLLSDLDVDLRPRLFRYTPPSFLFPKLLCFAIRSLRTISSCCPVPLQLPTNTRFVDSNLYPYLFLLQSESQACPYLIPLCKGKLMILFHGNSSMSPPKSEDAIPACPLTATSLSCTYLLNPRPKIKPPFSDVLEEAVQRIYSSAVMPHQIDLQETRLGIVPLAERANRNLVFEQCPGLCVRAALELILLSLRL